MPNLNDEKQIKIIAQSTPLPLNVLAGEGLSDFHRLKDLDVSRISAGGLVYRYMNRHQKQMIEGILKDRSVRHFI
ncbi:MAG: hypothetical protein AAGF85_17795 [Bacteroidota bacterium]